MADVGEHLRELSAQIAPILGSDAFMYSEWPTPTSGRYVFQGGSFGRVGALAHMTRLHGLVSAGEPLPYPYAYGCAQCTESFASAGERDAHVAQAGHARR